jgi:hypothetical protein
METLLESKNVVVKLDERGFVEVTVGEGYEIGLDDFIDIHNVLERRNLRDPRLLINRIHSYSTDASVLLLHSHEGQADAFRVKPGRVAYLVYQPVTEAVSELIGGLIFKHAPHEVFLDRDQAVAWLLAD